MWDNIANAVKELIKNGIEVLPLFKIKDKVIIPHGLYTLYNKRKGGDYSPVIFLVALENDVPDPLHPVNSCYNHVRKILTNPVFGSVEKAILMAEIRYHQGDGDDHPRLVNILDIFDEDFKRNLKTAVDVLGEKENAHTIIEWKKEYYKNLVTFYDSSEFNNSFSPEGVDQCSTITGATGDTEGADSFSPEGVDQWSTKFGKWENVQKQYDSIHGIKSRGDNPHSVNLELFRAPLPFLLQDIISAVETIKNRNRENNRTDKRTNVDNTNDPGKIKLLLIDNRVNKFHGGCDNPTIHKFFKGFGIEEHFEVTMLGGHTPDPKDDFKEQFELFDYHRFITRASLTNDEKEYHSKHWKKEDGNVVSIDQIERYDELVYYGIKSAHFVLLDFFLNAEDTYLAFDFIRHIEGIKKSKKEYGVFWYFITSEVYDSVQKYSQSGLLSEFYASSVVSSGDDPMNENRRIVFLYKFLTFVQGRISSFVDLEETIKNYLWGCKESPNYKCSQNYRVCFNGIQRLTKKYLAEYQDIKGLLGRGNDEMKDLVDLHDNILQQFLWLPEADWQAIEHEIEFFNARSLKQRSSYQFACKYINEEIKNRSEIY